MVGQLKLNKSNFYKNLFLNNYWAKIPLLFFYIYIYSLKCFMRAYILYAGNTKRKRNLPSVGEINVQKKCTYS